MGTDLWTIPFVLFFIILGYFLSSWMLRPWNLFIREIRKNEKREITGFLALFPVLIPLTTAITFLLVFRFTSIVNFMLLHFGYLGYLTISAGVFLILCGLNGIFLRVVLEREKFLWFILRTKQGG